MARKAAKPWYQAGFFDAAMGGVLFDQGAEEAADAEIRGLLKLTGLKRGNVLDTACGYGRHSRSLARQGFQVTGVDLMPGYLAEARKRAQAAGLAVRFERGELKDLRAYQGRFDLVLNLYTSFGYYAGDADNAACLRQMVRALRPGGWLALELQPRESLRAVVVPLEEHPLAKGVLKEERTWLAHGRLRTRVTWLRPGKTTVRDSVLRTYSRAELRALARSAGLARLKDFGSYQGRPYKAGGRLLLLGRTA